MSKRISEKLFWELIDDNKRDYENIMEELGDMGCQQAIDFANHLENIKEILSNSENVSVFASLTSGYFVSDDMFEYWIGGFIYEGEEIVKLALSNPDAIADMPNYIKSLSEYEMADEDAARAITENFGYQFDKWLSPDDLYKAKSSNGDEVIDWEKLSSKKYFKETFPKLWKEFGSHYEQGEE